MLYYSPEQNLFKPQPSVVYHSHRISTSFIFWPSTYEEAQNTQQRSVAVDKKYAMLIRQKNYLFGQVLFDVILFSYIEIIDWFLLVLFLWLHLGYFDLHQLRIWLSVFNLHNKW